MQGGGRLTTAMFAGGVATFAELYGIQAVLPGMAGAMTLSESSAALAISVATGALAIAVLPWAAVADRIGRARAMTISVSVATACGLLLPAAPNLVVLLVLRAVTGAALAAIPALAMAHLVEMAAPGRAAAAGGVYIAGTSVGGLSGRLLAGTVAGVIGGVDGWRWGLLVTALAVAVMTVVFAVLLPGAGTVREPHAPPGPGALTAPRVLVEGSPSEPHAAVHSRSSVPRGHLRQALSHRGAWALYAQGFLLMGGFVTIYNLLPFRLLAAPYRVPGSLVSLLFVTYLVGTAGSWLVGHLTGRFGRRPVMLAGAAGMAAGTLLMLAQPLPLVFAGLVIATFCFFLAHAIAAGWPGVLVPEARSQATALYSLGYYLGSAALGYVGAVLFTVAGWTGAALMVAGCAMLAVLVAVLLAPGSARSGDTRATRSA